MKTELGLTKQSILILHFIQKYVVTVDGGLIGN
jgi:hypothetical protein